MHQGCAQLTFSEQGLDSKRMDQTLLQLTIPLVVANFGFVAFHFFQVENGREPFVVTIELLHEIGRWLCVGFVVIPEGFRESGVKQDLNSISYTSTNKGSEEAQIFPT